MFYFLSIVYCLYIKAGAKNILFSFSKDCDLFFFLLQFYRIVACRDNSFSRLMFVVCLFKLGRCPSIVTWIARGKIKHSTGQQKLNLFIQRISKKGPLGVDLPFSLDTSTYPLFYIAANMSIVVIYLKSRFYLDACFVTYGCPNHNRFYSL